MTKSGGGVGGTEKRSNMDIVGKNVLKWKGAHIGERETVGGRKLG
jgi:hypothetical protein